ncbi:MAG: hypothetical protein HYT80_08230 [Euryarchaeota archaeon]|nr:hypothetical protein [Euryarchaeota archaeon]
MDDQALGWDDVIGIGVMFLAAIPFLISVLAYRRTPTTRVLLFTAAFGLFFVKGLIVAAESLVWHEHPVLNAYELVADALILFLFAAGMLKG